MLDAFEEMADFYFHCATFCSDASDHNL